MTTAQNIINNMASDLGQSANSYIFAIAAGTGQGQMAITPAEGAMKLINEAQADCVRMTIPIWDTATVTVTNSNILGPYNTITSAAGRTLAIPVNIESGNFTVQQSLLGYLFNGERACLDPAANCPCGWADQGSSAMLSVPTNGATTFAVGGYFLPIPLNTSGDPTSQTMDPWLDGEALRLITYWAVAEIIGRRVDVPDVMQRAQVFAPKMQALRQQVYERMVSSDSSISALFPPLPSNTTPPIVARPQAANI